MTQEELLEFNKLCAEFLGAKNLGKLGYSNLESYEHDLFIRTEWSNKYQDNIETDVMVLSSMSFHSDWNWIFEVVEAIEKLGYYTKNECIRNINYFNIYELENNEATFYGTDNSKKEAVVEAINQFLIWHKTNNNEK